uniref:Uncharacterized protein n=1 Tax=Solanum tuberosum TaxID=4113 RepID=M1DHA9_SOLTU
MNVLNESYRSQGHKASAMAEGPRQSQRPSLPLAFSYCLNLQEKDHKLWQGRKDPKWRGYCLKDHGRDHGSWSSSRLVVIITARGAPRGDALGVQALCHLGGATASTLHGHDHVPWSTSRAVKDPVEMTWVNEPNAPNTKPLS